MLAVGDQHGRQAILRERRPQVVVVARQLAGAAVAEVREQRRAVLDRRLVDSWAKCDDKDGFLMSRQMIREEGLLCGGSSGCAMACAIQKCKEKLWCHQQATSGAWSGGAHLEPLVPVTQLYLHSRKLQQRKRATRPHRTSHIRPKAHENDKQHDQMSKSAPRETNHPATGSDSPAARPHGISPLPLPRPPIRRLRNLPRCPPH